MVVLLATVLVLEVAGASGVLGGGLTLLCGALAAGVAALRVDGRGWGALGFVFSSAAPGEVLKGVGLGTLLGIAPAVLLWMTGGLVLSWEAGTLGDFLSIGWQSLALLALPAAAEEALARGYPLQLLAARSGGPWALFLTSLGFSALHLSNPELTAVALLSLALAGLVLGVVYLRTLSLWWATGVHLGWNWALGFWADQPISGLEMIDAPYIVTDPRGPAWWGGGGFGPEGSLASVLVLIGALFWLSRTPMLRPSAGALAAGPLCAVSFGGIHTPTGTPGGAGSTSLAVSEPPNEAPTGD